MKKILFATSELYPLVKTGGLADVSYSLPKALAALDTDVRVIVPGYPDVFNSADNLKPLCNVAGFMIPKGTRIYEGELPGTKVKLWVVDCAECFKREGGLYVDSLKQEWPDNAYRFSIFCRVIAELALGRCEQPWRPDVVHCNDWQTGLAPAFIQLALSRPATVFTIHNLAYQGNFSKEVFEQLMLPLVWWNIDAIEFYHKMSFLKAGVVFSDQVTTVSPTYAKEILSHEYGYGMDGLLHYHQNKLVGILNGADYETWNPETDPDILFNYSETNLENKVKNKLDLQRKLGLKLSKGTPLFGVVSRLVHQKGIDYVIDAIEENIGKKMQWVILGTGENEFEKKLTLLAQKYPNKIALKIGYNESLAHKIEASADVFVMASRYEPCGLNQIYSLRYGTLPLVRNTGGLADTVVDTQPDTVKNNTATGFVFNEPSTKAFTETIERVLSYYRTPAVWQAIQKNAMKQDFSWSRSAASYLSVYENAINLSDQGQKSQQLTE